MSAKHVRVSKSKLKSRSPHAAPALVGGGEFARLTKRFRTGITAITEQPDALERLTLVADLMDRLLAAREEQKLTGMRLDILETTQRVDAAFGCAEHSSAVFLLEKAVAYAADEEIPAMLEAVLSVISDGTVHELRDLRDSEEKMLAEYHAEQKRGAA